MLEQGWNLTGVTREEFPETDNRGGAWLWVGLLHSWEGHVGASGQLILRQA